MNDAFECDLLLAQVLKWISCKFKTSYMAQAIDKCINTFRLYISFWDVCLSLSNFFLPLNAEWTALRGALQGLLAMMCIIICPCHPDLLCECTDSFRLHRHSAMCVYVCLVFSEMGLNMVSGCMLCVCSCFCIVTIRDSLCVCVRWCNTPLAALWPHLCICALSIWELMTSSRERKKAL